MHIVCASPKSLWDVFLQCGIPFIGLAGEAGWLDPILALLFSFLNENMCLLWERRRDEWGPVWASSVAQFENSDCVVISALRSNLASGLIVCFRGHYNKGTNGAS